MKYASFAHKKRCLLSQAYIRLRGSLRLCRLKAPTFRLLQKQLPCSPTFTAAGFTVREGLPLDTQIASLKGKDPDEVHARGCAAQGTQVDRCALYCYRLAVYYADHNGQLPEGKRNWWEWKM